MISYAMLPSIPSSGARVPALLLALRQLEWMEARLEGLRAADPPPSPAQRWILDVMEIQISGDLGRLLMALQEGGRPGEERDGIRVAEVYRCGRLSERLGAGLCMEV